MTAAPRYPAGPAEVDAQWLGDRLGAQVASYRIEPVGVGTGQLGLLARIVIDYEPGSAGPASVVMKLRPEGELSRQLADALDMSRREVGCYQQISASTPLRMPRCHCADLDEASADYVLLIEDLSDRRCVDQIAGCGHDDAVVALRALAAHHAFFWNLDAAGDWPWLNRLADPPNSQAIPPALTSSWPMIDAEFGDLLTGRVREVARGFSSYVVDVMAELSKPPLTLLHGDYRLDNLYFAVADDQPPVVAGDWQLAMTGRGVYDCAYFLGQNMTPAQRRQSLDELMRGYYDGLVAGGVTGYSYDELWRDFRRAALFHLCYPLTAGSMDLANDRAVLLLRTMLERAVSLVVDLDALDLLDV